MFPVTYRYVCKVVGLEYGITAKNFMTELAILRNHLSLS
jgi:hypothetical protein